MKKTVWACVALAAAAVLSAVLSEGAESVPLALHPVREAARRTVQRKNVIAFFMISKPPMYDF